MSQEIIDAVREIEREKGIEGGTLIDALQDGLLAAYKKTPGAARHAVVELDDNGDFRVYAVQLPDDVEERLMDEARERALEELERLEAENGERSHVLLNDDDLEIDWSDVPEEQVQFEDVTRLSFADASRDLVVSFDVLEHVPDYRQALREFARVLAPGGALVLTAPFVQDFDFRASGQTVQVRCNRSLYLVGAYACVRR